MANVFDQFDKKEKPIKAVEPSVPKEPNYFDQFDTEEEERKPSDIWDYSPTVALSNWLLGEETTDKGLRAIEDYSAGYHKDLGGTPEQRARAVSQGLTLGHADEIEAGIRAPFSDKSYTEIRDDIREQNKEYREEYPFMATGLEIAGAAPTMFIPGVGWVRPVEGLTEGAKAIHTAKNLSKLAAEGAGYGSVAGAGYSEGETVGEVASDVWDDALVGGILNPAIGGGFRAGEKLIRSTTYMDKLKKYVDADVPFGAADVNKLAGGVRSLADATYGGTVAATQRVKRLSEEAEEGLNKLLDVTGGSKFSEEAGLSLRSQIHNSLEAKAKQAGKLFKKIDERQRLFATIPTKTKQAIEDLTSTGVGEKATPSIVKSMSKALEDHPEQSVQELWDARMWVGDALTTGKLGKSDVPQGKLNLLYKALSEDLDNAFKQMSGTDLKRWKRANEYWKDYRDIEQRVNDLLGTASKVDAAPEDIITKLQEALRHRPSRLNVLGDIEYKETGQTYGDVYPETKGTLIGEIPYEEQAVNLAGAGSSVLNQLARRGVRGEYDPRSLSDALTRGDNRTESVLEKLFSEGKELKAAERVRAQADIADDALRGQQRLDPLNPLGLATGLGSSAGALYAGGIPAAIGVNVGGYALRRLVDSDASGKMIAELLKEQAKIDQNFIQKLAIRAGWSEEETEEFENWINKSEQ